MPIMAGIEYCNSSLPIGASPKIWGLFSFIKLVFINFEVQS